MTVDLSRRRFSGNRRDRDERQIRSMFGGAPIWSTETLVVRDRLVEEPILDEVLRRQCTERLTDADAWTTK
jgi:hypothetical protein